MLFVHISDIHWRPLVRHDEYRDVFNRIFDTIRGYKEEFEIVLTGDLLHEKNKRITPEIIEELSWMLKEMNDIATTHIILGNHDLNLANKNRLDSLTPIINALDLPNIKFYKNSGNYAINEQFNFSVFSCIDEKEWEKVKPVPGKINIALFHGAVAGAMTDVGYSMDGEVKLDFFDPFDFTFLGDIHRCQFLDSSRRIAYPGSTVQQNFGESIDRHGFLLWDIKSRDHFRVDLVEIENTKPFVTIDWAGSVKATVALAEKYPNGSRFRIYHHEPLNNKDFVQLSNEIKRVKETDHVVSGFDKKKGNDVEAEVTNQFKRNLRDPKVIVELLQKFYGEAEFTPEQWEEVKNILSDYIKSLSTEDDDVERGIVWRPMRLEFDNFMQYGEGNVVDFRHLTGVVGVFGPNRFGKSTFLGAISFVLFGKLDREINQNHNYGVVNERKTECSVRLMFEVNGKYFLIERTAEKVDKKDGRYGLKSKVWFWEVDEAGNIIKELHEEKPQETDKAIRKMVGTIDDFKLTTIAPQKKLESFIEDYKSTERKKILYRFRDLHVLQEIHTKAKEDLSGMKAVLKSLTPIDWNAAISTLRAEKLQLESDLEKHQSWLEKMNETLENLQKDLSLKDDKDIITSSQVEEQEEVVKKLQEDKDKLEIQIALIETRQKELNDKLALVTEKKDGIPVEKLKEKLERRNALERQLAQLQATLEAEKKVLQGKNKTVSKLKLVPCGDQYPTCRYIVDAHTEKGNIKPQEELIESIEKEAMKCQALMVDDEDYRSRIREYDELCEKEMTLVRKISAVSVREFQVRLENLKDKLEKATEKLEYYRLNVCDDARNDVVQLRDRVAKVKAEIRETDQKRIRAASRMGTIDAEIEKHLGDQEKFLEIDKKYHIYDKLNFAFGKKGIPNQIIRMDLPGLNAAIKDVFQGVIDFDVVLDIEEESDKLEIYMDYGHGLRPIELGCGVEKAIASIAIRVGLTNASSLSKPDFLAFDEAFDGLDDNHIDSLVSIFSSLRKQFKNVFVISHKDIVKDMADTVLDITRQGLDSHLYLA